MLFLVDWDFTSHDVMEMYNEFMGKIVEHYGSSLCRFRVPDERAKRIKA